MHSLGFFFLPKGHWVHNSHTSAWWRKERKEEKKSRDLACLNIRFLVLKREARGCHMMGVGHAMGQTRTCAGARTGLGWCGDGEWGRKILGWAMDVEVLDYIDLVKNWGWMRCIDRAIKEGSRTPGGAERGLRNNIPLREHHHHRHHDTWDLKCSSEWLNSIYVK